MIGCHHRIMSLVTPVLPWLEKGENEGGGDSYEYSQSSLSARARYLEILMDSKCGIQTF